tara:strand:- start:113 stop:481 length:369 start_codon:yes stop_codon:yes gene_type:complete
MPRKANTKTVQPKVEETKTETQTEETQTELIVRDDFGKLAINFPLPVEWQARYDDARSIHLNSLEHANAKLSTKLGESSRLSLATDIKAEKRKAWSKPIAQKMAWFYSIHALVNAHLMLGKK